MATVRQGMMSTVILLPFFLWASIILNQLFSLTAKKRLIVSTVVFLANISGFLLFRASGHLL